MKNREKYAKEILDIVCKGNGVAMDKKTKKLVPCRQLRCKECYFLPVNYPNNKFSCEKNFVHWVNNEYKEGKEFSEEDKLFVRAMDKINWFAKDKSGEVFGFIQKPYKSDNEWCVTNDKEWRTKENTQYIRVINENTLAMFKSLSWDDDEPINREEILRE